MKNEFLKTISFPDEQWKDVLGFEGRYAISSFGRIASLGAPYTQGNKVCTRQPSLMTPHLGKGNPGYLQIQLSDGNGTRKSFLIHRLVAQAFISNPNDLPYVNHKDECSTNNNVSNLEWCDQKYNCNYGTHTERMAKTISDTAYQKRIVLQFTKDWEFIAQHNSIKEAANSVPCSHSTVSLCCRKKTNLGKGYHWIYKEDLNTYKDTIKNINSVYAQIEPGP